MQKKLFLLRHAKSSWKDINQIDFDRPLNRRGNHDAPIMGKRIQLKHKCPEKILCSTALRARQTLTNLRLDSAEITFDDSIYQAVPKDLLNIIKKQEQQFNSLMLVGHNPSITMLASYLLKVHLEDMPTCSLYILTFDTVFWKDIEHCSIAIEDYDYPKKHINFV